VIPRPDGEQLELDLELCRVPWGGRSPRSLTLSLTDVDNSVTLGAHPTGGPIRVDPFQLTMFLQGTPYGS